MSSETLVLRSVAAAVERLRLSLPWYAAEFFNPPAGEQEREILAAAHAVCHLVPWADDVGAFALPAQGPDRVYTIAINQLADRAQRPLALRHEVWHILAGEADIVYLAERGWKSPSERAADTFAIADLVPARWIGGRRPRTVRRSALQDVRDAISGFVELWPEARIVDRARLRLQLLRHHGI